MKIAAIYRSDEIVPFLIMVYEKIEEEAETGYLYLNHDGNMVVVQDYDHYKTWNCETEDDQSKVVYILKTVISSLDP